MWGSRTVTLGLSTALAAPLVVCLWYFTNVSPVFAAIICIATLYVIIGNITYLQKPNLRLLYVLLILVKLTTLVIVINFKPGFLSGVDWVNFHGYAVDAASSSNNIFELYSNSLDLFVFLMSLVYKIFGFNADNIFLLVFLTSAILFRVIFKSAQLLGANNTLSSVAGLVISAWPVGIIYSSMLLRELPAQLAVALSFYFFIKSLKQDSRKNLLCAVLIGLIGSTIHSGLLVVPVVYVYLYLQGRARPQKKLVALKPLLAVSLVFLALVASPVGGGVFSRFNSIDDIDAINSQYEFQLTASTTYIDSTSDSLGGFAASLPYRFVMFALSPLPWQIRGFDTAISWLLDGLLQIFVVIYLYRAWREYRKNTINSHEAILLKNVIVAGLLCVFLSYAVFAMGTNNYGSAMRHRTKVLPVIVLTITSYTLLRSLERKENEINVLATKKNNGRLPKRSIIDEK